MRVYVMNGTEEPVTIDSDKIADGFYEDFANADAFVPTAWAPCKPYVYLPMRLKDAPVGISILAPVR